MLNLVFTALIFALFLVYAWSLYNIFILAAGVKHLRRSEHKPRKTYSGKEEDLPIFSIVVPVKNEEKVMGRLLDALSQLNYPADKKEIIIVEDGSIDRTLDICTEYSKKTA